MIYGILHEKRLESVTIKDWNWSIYMETKKDFFWCIVTYMLLLYAGGQYNKCKCAQYNSLQKYRCKEIVSKMNTPISINQETKAIGIHIYLSNNYPLMVPPIRSTVQLGIKSSRRIGNTPMKLGPLHWIM